MGDLRRNIVRKGREYYAGYKVLNRDFDRRNLDAVISVLNWCSRNMRDPKMLHYVVGIEDDEIFNSTRFAQKFKERFYSCIHERNRVRNKGAASKRTKLPEVQLIFSVESKYLDPLVPVPYLHFHLMVIVDTNYHAYGFHELNIAINRALSGIHGLESLTFDSDRAIFFKDAKEWQYGFLKFRNENSSVKVGDFKEFRWHDIRTELADAVCRASYLCKLDQKELLPDKFKRGNSFGHTRPKGTVHPTQKLPSDLLIGSQLEFL